MVYQFTANSNVRNIIRVTVCELLAAVISTHFEGLFLSPANGK
jgi:hypothetical protein